MIMIILEVLMMFIVGAYVGKLMAMVVYYLPPILLEGCDKGREPDDIWTWFFSHPFCWKCQKQQDLKAGIPLIGTYFHSSCPECHFFYKRRLFLEAAMAIYFAVMVILTPISLPLIFVLIATAFLICCFFTDLDYGVLPDQLTMSLLWVALIGTLVPIFATPQEAIIGSVAGYGVFWFLNVIYRLVRKFDGMFPGDFKLNAAVGAAVGYKLLYPILMVAFALLVIYAGLKFYVFHRLSASHVLNKEVSYGCYLAIAAIGGLHLLFFGFI